MIQKILKNYKSLCYYSPNILFLEKEFSLYTYDIHSDYLKIFLTLEISWFKRILSKLNLVKRFLRLGVRYAIVEENELYLCYEKQIFQINLQTKKIKIVHRLLRGSSPLSITKISSGLGFQEGLYFGEYFISSKCESVNIYQKLNNSDEFQIVYTFEPGTINHIHALIEDRFNGCIWILTGDFTKSSGIWMAKNDFTIVEPILVGEQEYRACVAFPTNDGLIYATDSNIKPNSLRILMRVDNKWESKIITSLNGPCIYGCKFGDSMIFSTSTEPDPPMRGCFLFYLFSRKPGKGIIKNYSQIYQFDGSREISIIYTNKKDSWPYGFFQFGTIIFPSGQSSKHYLVFYNLANKSNDMSTIILKY